MEKINNESLEEAKAKASEPEKEASLKINVFRHGAAKYEQGKVPFGEVKDLKPEGAKEVEKNAEALAELIGPDEEVAIWSSPLGRTLETAKIVARVLRDKGIKLRQKGTVENSGIKAFNELSEVKNFSWRLFEPLVIGGELEFAGKKFFVDKSLTNPKNFGIQDYFSKDGIGTITEAARAQLPEEYVREIDSFEKAIDVAKRLMKPLGRLKKVGDKNYRVVIVTHDGLCAFPAEVFSGGKEHGLGPGQFMSFERKDDKLAVTGVGDSKEGKSDVDVTEEFKRQSN